MLGSFLASPIGGKIAGAAIGGILGGIGGKQDRANMNYANEQSNMGYLDARPYLKKMYERGQNALDNAINTGYYQGDTYANMNPLTGQGYTNMGNLGQMGYNNAVDFMNTGKGFGQNYADLYNQASQNTLANAQAYATDPANYQGLVDSALRDSRRNLEENTLRGIDIAASGSGNANSSRAGVADAIAARGFADREADTRAAIQNRLQNDYMRAENDRFANMTTANNNLGTLYNTGFNQGNLGNTMMVNAGKGFQQDEQNRMNDDRARFEGNRDFELDMLSRYNAGIMNRAPTQGSTYAPNMYSPTAGALGGAQMGFGMGGNMFPQLMNFFNPQQSAPVQPYSGGFNNMGSMRGYFS